jgi:hypothetical protein
MKKIAHRRGMLACLVFAMAAFASCGDANESDEQTTVVAAAGENGAAGPAEAPDADVACPPAADVAAAVGHPVGSKPLAGCYYQTADFETSVSITPISSGEADQLERELASLPHGAEVTAIEIGDRGQAWAAPGYAQGYAIDGSRGWKVDVHATSGGNVTLEPVIQVLRIMMD